MSDRAPLGYRFEEFSLLIDKRLLVKDDGTRIRLRPKPFKTLLLLLQNAPRPVTREQFESCVWEKTAVEDQNLTVAIRALRKDLGDSATECRYIETIPKEGYRFIPSVRPIESQDSNQDVAAEEPGHYDAGARAGDHARSAKATPHENKPAATRKRRLPISSSVPAPLVSLVGREREVKELSALLLRWRLVSIVGAGGSGKTELGQQTGAGAAKHFPDGVVFVSLASITDPGLVGSTIAQTLAVRESGTQSLNDTLANSLKKKKLLLLLDNFEHLISAAEFVAWLLRMCPCLTVLVTSRAPLRVSGEHVYPVEPLPLPDLKKKPTVKALADCPSVALFVERVRAARGDFKLTDENAAVVAEICRTTGGLPLAIELAAAQAGLLSLDEMLARSERRKLDLFTLGRRDAPDRQQTMAKNIEWSYQLFSAEEKRLFARLSVFVGGFTRDSAEAVCGGEGQEQRAKGQGGGGPEAANAQIMHGLTSLLENRLITPERSEKSGLEPRFNMLEVIREYASDRLTASGELATIRRRHAEFFCGLAEQAEPGLIGPAAFMTLDLLEAELGNLRAAMQWSMAGARPELAAQTAAAMRAFWIQRGSLEEGLRWLMPAIHQRSDLPIATRARSLNAAARLLERQGQYENARALLEEAIPLYRTADSGEALAYALLVLGDVWISQREFKLAISSLEESLAIAEEREDHWTVGSALTSMATLAHYQGNDEHAMKLDERALKIFEELQDARATCNCLGNIGFLWLLRANSADAMTYLRRSLSLVHADDRIRIAGIVESIATARAATGELRCALRLLGAADASLEDAGAVRPRINRAEVEEIKALARTRLGASAFNKAWKAGRCMTTADAKAYAFKVTQPHKARPPTRRLRKTAKQSHQAASA